MKGSLGTLVRGVSCNLKVTGSSRGIGHWKQVRPPTIHPLGCGPSRTLRMRDALCTGLPLFIKTMNKSNQHYS